MIDRRLDNAGLGEGLLITVAVSFVDLANERG